MTSLNQSSSTLSLGALLACLWKCPRVSSIEFKSSCVSLVFRPCTRSRILVMVFLWGSCSQFFMIFMYSSMSLMVIHALKILLCRNINPIFFLWLIKFIMSREGKALERNKSTEKIIKNKADFTYLAPFNYRILKEIGRGGYGVVYKASEISNPENLSAIKINFNTVSRQLIYAEMAFLMLVKNNERLPKLLNLFVYKDFTHIVIEYFKFKPFITFFNTFPLLEVKHYIYELLLGLKELKSLGIYHRDIKPGNFLYNPEKRRGLIIDFGLAEIDPIFKEKLEKRVQKMNVEKDPKYEEELGKLKIYRRLSDCLKIIGRNKIGTETYMPLESILHHSEQTYESDIWPVGVILLQFAARKYNIFNSVKILNKPEGIKNCYYINYLIELATFYGSEQVIAECKKLNYDLKLPADIDRLTFSQIKIMDEYDEEMDDILHKLMCLDAKKRITVEQALQHSFFNEIRSEH